MDILQKIAADKRIEIEALKGVWHIDELPRASSIQVPYYSFHRSLETRSAVCIIAELKRKSPSRGELTGFFDLESTVRAYREGGAAALSVLTDRTYFGGDPSFVARAKQVAELPALYKDFVIDEFQLHYARAMGADAVLLIVRLLTRRDLERFLKLAAELRLDCLVETHSLPEVEIALESGARIIGVNSRDLSTFSVSLKTAETLAAAIPDQIIKVAESGISSPDEIRHLRTFGYSGFLVGEALMKSDDPVTLLKSMVQA